MRCLALALVLAAAIDGCAAKMSKAEYARKAEDFRNGHTKEQFLKEFNKDRKQKATGARGERIWSYVNEQLDNGRLRFMEDNTIQYALPISDLVAPYLPEPASNLLEAVLKVGRTALYKLVSLARLAAL
jgi:hypothetical protein